MSMTAAHLALDRTGILLADDVHQGRLDKADVIEGLLDARVEIRATEAELQSVAAQTAVVTLTLQLAMCGIGVWLNLPDVKLAASQPPLLGDRIRTALTQHLTHSFPWVHYGEVERPDLRYTIGQTPVSARSDIVVTGMRGRLSVGPASGVAPTPWTGLDPIVPMGAALAAVGYAIRSASWATAERHGILEPVLVDGTTSIALRPTAVADLDLGTIPIVSAGAITHAAVQVLLRVPRVRGRLHPFDDDRVELSNFNRYPLLTAKNLDALKASSLDTWSTERLVIEGHDHRYRGGEYAGTERLLVGADDIGVRWTAQDDVRDWLGIGATSHLFAAVSTHVPGSPCAGCVHDHEDAAPGVIPTISVVSGWAGLILASELLSSFGQPRSGRLSWSYPLGLPGRSGHVSPTPAPSHRCPRHCDLSRRAA